MNRGPLSGRTIRSAVVRGRDLGNILACDIEREREDTAHAYIAKWQAGEFVESEANFDAHSICSITHPEPALVFIAPPGEYGIHSRGGSIAGDIITSSRPQPNERRHRGFRSVAEIGGKAYAVGLRGTAYRLDDLRTWTRIDEGLPESFDIRAIHGFGADDIYAVGRNGHLWHYDGNGWTKRELPTNANLTSVKCAGDGTVYVGGHKGVLIQGREQSWQVIEQDETEDDIWDVEWFNDTLYVSTIYHLYQLVDGQLGLVDFGGDTPKSCYQLSTANGVMWSNGEFDIMSFDGETWTRVV